MGIFDYNDSEALGIVKEVDTATVIVEVTELEKLRKMQVNRLVALQSSKPGEKLIGMVQRIVRSTKDSNSKLDMDSQTDIEIEENFVRVTLIGTYIDKIGDRSDIFKRTLETVPEIDANCFSIEDEVLTKFMRVLSRVGEDKNNLTLGNYSLDEKADAYLNGNKFFQRHAIIVGSTGSGKSWTTAKILEQVSELSNANAIVFDIHGEYKPLEGEGISYYRIAGPNDHTKSSDNSIIYLPYWLLGYEAMVAMLVDRSDQNAPNQTMLISQFVKQAKEKTLSAGNYSDILENFTIDSPIPYDINEVCSDLEALDVEMVPGTRSEKQGPYHGKLSRLIARLKNKQTDRRLGFMFSGGKDTQEFNWLENLSTTLLGDKEEHSKKTGVKIIDFSEVPSDLLPLIVSLVAQISFSVQQWTLSEKRHPIAIFCDEAHLYIPERSHDASNELSVSIFERIAKEGRKYGVGLVIISQRPSEVNRTVLSQCNNVVAMRLTNAEDQNVIRRLLPDNLGGFSDYLPILDEGEALVVGDSSLLPSRIRVSEPKRQPNSGTVDFWNEWSQKKSKRSIPNVITNWRKQNLSG